jgi:hypothetical protein
VQQRGRLWPGFGSVARGDRVRSQEVGFVQLRRNVDLGVIAQLEQRREVVRKREPISRDARMALRDFSTAC